MKTNGTFNYKPIQNTEIKDPKTGWKTFGNSGIDEWLAGCGCQISRSIPAKQVLGTDGQMHSYSFDVFIPKYFPGADLLVIGANIQVVSEDGITTDEFTIQGVDPYNRKYVELWG